MPLEIWGVPIIVDFSFPMTSEEVEAKVDEWESLLDQGKQEEADALYDELSDAGALGG